MKPYKEIIYYPTTRNDKPVKWLCISAHPDDAEIMAVSAILNGYYSKSHSFALVVTTDGAGSARSGIYKDYTNEEMIEVRKKEQIKASELGRYHSLCMLNHSSKEAKENNEEIIEEYIDIIKELKPNVIYTHSILDKHPTHVAVAIKVIKALRKIDKEYRPSLFYGCEVWRGLDWIDDERKIGFDVSRNIKLQKELLRCFASQVDGGKDYLAASIGRRYQNATYFKSHNVDKCKMIEYMIDMSPSIETSIKEYVSSFVKELQIEIDNNIEE